MVNTPRSVDDLLDLFADGGPISAQDLRDFVVSLADPVDEALGGGDPFFGTVVGSASITSGQALLLDAASASSYHLPDGWLVDDGDVDEETWWGWDLTNAVLQPPSGLFWWQTELNVATTLDPGDKVGVDADFTVDPSGSGLGVATGPAAFGQPFVSADGGTWMRQGMIRLVAPLERTLFPVISVPVGKEVVGYTVTMFKVA